MRRRLFERVEAKRAVAGRLQIPHGPRVAGLCVVVADDGGELLRLVREERLERLADAKVQVAPLSLEDRAVRGLLRERVAERVLALGLARPLLHELEALECAQLRVELVRRLADRGEDAVEERAADDGGRLERLPRIRLEPIDTCCEDRLQRVGESDLGIRPGDAPARAGAGDRSVVEQRVDDLFQEERVPFGLVEDPVAQPRWDPFSRQRVHEKLGALRHRERRQHKLVVAVREIRLELLLHLPRGSLTVGTERADEQDRRFVHDLEQLDEQVCGRRVTPLQVVEYEDGPPRAEREREVVHEPVYLSAQLLALRSRRRTAQLDCEEDLERAQRSLFHAQALWQERRDAFADDVGRVSLARARE